MTTAKGKTGWHYECKGQGEPLVFIHGWAGDGRLWFRQREHFSTEYRVVTIDLPGHGKTGWKPTNLEGLSRDIDFFLEEIDLRQINLVGSSLGGLIALKIFDLFPHRVKRLACVGTLPRFSQTENYPFGLPSAWIEKLSRQLETDYPSIVNIFFRSLFTRAERESDCFRRLKEFRNDDEVPHREALHEFLKILENEDLREVFGKIKQSGLPVQILNGTHDYICSTQAVAFLKESIPAAEVKLFADCGHFPFLTVPEEFNRELERFLKNNR